jgi:demethylmenaquinone methyltransferase/2-methoxy-6-polyprenyl-1,4-benzoquinol methylase
MLQEAKRRFAGGPIHWQVCDANTLPYGDGSLAAVTFGYLLRNVAEIPRVLAEVYRVLQPGGTVVCLDTTPPEKTFYRPLLTFYLNRIVPIIGRILARDEAAYAYLTGSTMGFHEARELATLFEEAGFTQVSWQKFMFGTIAVHWGTKT